MDGAAFVDSLGYMLKGMVGIFLVIAIIMAVIMILNKVTGKEKKEKEA
ncbi:MAG TPA: oxaloacetate decarboxylase [Candidatus Pullichristensenella stercoripullorum]|nr:oxaloacetate decarboxylase [Candidatus Pullichristensenella stercoripullorum]